MVPTIKFMINESRIANEYDSQVAQLWLTATMGATGYGNEGGAVDIWGCRGGKQSVLPVWVSAVGYSTSDSRDCLWERWVRHGKDTNIAINYCNHSVINICCLLLVIVGYCHP